MAHFASKRYNYWGQLGVLLAFAGLGLVIGGIVSLIPLIGKIHMKDLVSATSFMDRLLVPENAALLRWMQFLSTLFLFFLPVFLYALVCHQKPFLHLGFKHELNIQSFILVALIMFAGLPLVSSLQDITEMLPWSKEMLLQFKAAENEYNRQVIVIARMNNFADYLISVFIIALLPAIFEETLFRGGIQNLLSRWFRMPVLAIVITALLFSAVHGSYLGFLSRFALGFLLGWIYYRTGNIWLNIFGHFFNNAIAVTSLYLVSKPGKPVDISKMDEHLPVWIGAISIGVIILLCYYFEKVARKEIDRPGEEILIGNVPGDLPEIASRFEENTLS